MDGSAPHLIGGEQGHEVDLGLRRGADMLPGDECLLGFVDQRVDFFSGEYAVDVVIGRVAPRRRIIEDEPRTK